MSPSEQKIFATFPAFLRTLVEAEVQAGNAVVELSYGYPAAPCGAYIKLARPVSTRPRQSEGELVFYDRNTPSFSGEFSNSDRHFFVLEPPHPPEPPPDMDAIRERLKRMDTEAAAARARAREGKGSEEATRQGGSRASKRPAEAPASTTDRVSKTHRVTAPAPERASAPAPKPRRDAPSPVPATAPEVSVATRFQASMVLDSEKWREGTGYDLALLKQATPADLAAIQDLLVRHSPRDWRDVEALSQLDTPGARAALRDALRDPDAQVRMAVHRYAPDLFSEAERIDSLVQAIETAASFSGLSQTLEEVQVLHPPPVVAALLRGLMERDGATAVHYAAMLFYLHGKADSPFDWSHRPFFLRFNTDDPGERETVVRELCATLEIDPRRCFKPKPAT